MWEPAAIVRSGALLLALATIDASKYGFDTEAKGSKRYHRLRR